MADSSKRLQVFHSFKNAGGTLLRPENKLMFLFGTGTSAFAIQVNDPTFMADCPLITPKIDKFCICSLVVEIADITALDKNGLETYPGAASFLPAHWLLDVVAEALSSNPFILISKAIKAAKAFDQDHNSVREYITLAVHHVDDFILWAWGVGAGQVSKTKYSIDPNNNDLNYFYIEGHQVCISIPRVTWAAAAGVMPPPPAVDNLAVLGLLNTTIPPQADKQEEQNKLLSKQLEHMIEQDGPKITRIKNFHKSTLKMILFASAMDREMVPDKHVDSSKRFMNCKSYALAEQDLNNQFES